MENETKTEKEKREAANLLALITIIGIAEEGLLQMHQWGVGNPDVLQRDFDAAKYTLMGCN